MADQFKHKEEKHDIEFKLMRMQEDQNINFLDSRSSDNSSDEGLKEENDQLKLRIEELEKDDSKTQMIEQLKT